MMRSKDFQTVMVVILIFCFFLTSIPTAFSNVFAYLPIIFGLFDRVDRGIRQWVYPDAIMKVYVKPGEDYRNDYFKKNSILYPSDRRISLGETNLSKHFQGTIEGTDSEGKKICSFNGAEAYSIVDHEKGWETWAEVSYIGKNVNGISFYEWLIPQNEGKFLRIRKITFKDTIGGVIKMDPIPAEDFESTEVFAEYQKILTTVPNGGELRIMLTTDPEGKNVIGTKGFQMTFLGEKELASRFYDPNMDIAYFQDQRINQWRQEQGITIKLDVPETSHLQVLDKYGLLDLSGTTTGREVKVVPIETWMKGATEKEKVVQFFLHEKQQVQITPVPTTPVDCKTGLQTGIVDVYEGKTIKFELLSQYNSKLSTTSTNSGTFQKAVVKVSGVAHGNFVVSCIPEGPVLAKNLKFDGSWLWDEVNASLNVPVNKMMVNFQGKTGTMTTLAPQTTLFFDMPTYAKPYIGLDSSPLISRVYRSDDKEFALPTIQSVQNFVRGEKVFQAIGGKSAFIIACDIIQLLSRVINSRYQEFSNGDLCWLVAGGGVSYMDFKTGKEIPTIKYIKGLNWRGSDGVICGDTKWRDVSVWDKPVKIWVSKKDIEAAETAGVPTLIFGIIAKCGNMTAVLYIPKPKIPTLTPKMPGLQLAPPIPEKEDNWNCLVFYRELHEGHKVVTASTPPYVPFGEMKIELHNDSSSAASSAASGGNVSDINNTATGGSNGPITTVATGGSSAIIGGNQIQQTNVIVPKTADQSIR